MSFWPWLLLFLVSFAMGGVAAEMLVSWLRMLRHKRLEQMISDGRVAAGRAAATARLRMR